jgi:hypothetical protein
MATLVTPTAIQKMEFNVTTAEGNCRVTVVTGKVLVPNQLRVLSSGPEAQQSGSYKVLLDPTLAPGKFRKATATVSPMDWAATTNSLPGSSLCSIEDAQATFDDEAGQVQLVIDVSVKASGDGNITQFFGSSFQVTTLALV